MASRKDKSSQSALRVNDLVDTGQSKRIHRACLIQEGVIDTHVPGLVLLKHEDWVGQPLGVKDFHDAAGYEQLGDLFVDYSSLVFVKMSKRLLDRLGAWTDVKFVLGEFPRHTRHVLWRPCKDVSVLMKELGELAFLFAAEAGSDYHTLGGIGGIQINPLVVLGSLKLGLIISSLGLPNRQRCLDLSLGHGHDLVELAPLLGNDQLIGQLGTGCGALDGLLVVAAHSDDALRA